MDERDFTLAETYDADEAFVTGTFGGVTPVAMIDGRRTGVTVPATSPGCPYAGVATKVRNGTSG